MRLPLPLLALLLTATTLIAGEGPARSSPVSDLVDRGNQAIRDHDWATAEASFRAALESATAAGDTLWQFRCWFYLGVVHQWEAASERDPERRKALLEKTKEPYQRALALKPDSAAALTNLSEAELQTGNHEAAIALMERGLSMGKPEFARVLGDAYRSLGRREDAARYYLQAAAANREDLGIHDGTMATLLGGKDTGEPLGSMLVAYLNGLLDSREIDRAADGALRALETPLSAESTRGVLTILALALAEKDYDLVAFNRSPVGQAVTRMTAGDNAAVRDALAGIVRLYRGEVDDPAAYMGWTDDRPILEGTEPRSPLGAFRALVHSVAATAARNEVPIERVEAYYLMAIALAPERVDPGAVRRLAGIYAARNEIAKLDALYRAFDERLSEINPTPQEAEDIYEFHRLIGRTSASLPRNHPMRGVAVQELEHARDAGSGATVEPELHAQLAHVYALQGEVDKSQRERFAAAQAYFVQGDYTGARGALVSLGIDPPNVEGTRYTDLVNELVLLPENIEASLTPDRVPAVKRNLLLLSSGGNGSDRARAEAELRRLGVTASVIDGRMEVRNEQGVAKGFFYLPPRPIPTAATAK